MKIRGGAEKRVLNLEATSKNVIPAKAGIHKLLKLLSSRLCGNDELGIIRGPLIFGSKERLNNGANSKTSKYKTPKLDSVWVDDIFPRPIERKVK
ncbi:MAG: hypothetical protein FJ130_12040 [Deltaproteobacteria bacterium]|nr:hypothetical protein [Deltaproteobacteria bacterium]